jgi:hypothetical protein
MTFGEDRMVLALVIAAAAETSTSWEPFAQLGAIGVLCIVLIGFARGAYQREVRRADAAEAALQALQTKVIDLISPAAERMTMVVADFVAEARRDRDRR